MTLSKLAKLAHVSVSTASKAFSMSSEVNEETRAHIFQIAKEQGCFKKFFNAKYPRYVIAILCPEIKSHYYTRYVTYLQEFLEKNLSCEICIATTDFSADTEKTLVEYYAQYSSVDGLILIGGHADYSKEYEIPIVNIQKSGCLEGPSFSSDLLPAFTELASYLATHHITSVGAIGEPYALEKCALFQKTMADHGIPCPQEYISIADARFEEGGYQAMERLFQQKALPRVLFCTYDNMAIGAMRCIAKHGLSIPRDIAVLGSDNLSTDAFLTPPLASISSHTEELCRLAAESLLQQIKGENPLLPTTIPATLHLRESMDLSL